MRNRANEYEIRRLDRRLEALETELSRLVHSRDPVLDELAQTRGEMIEDLQAEIVAARARLDELLG